MKNQKSIAPPLAVAAVAATLLVSTGFSTYAALTTKVSNPAPQSVSAGTLVIDLTDSGDGFSENVSGLAPGDSVKRYVTLSNIGTIEGSTISLEVTSSGDESLITDGSSLVTTKALTLEISSCTVAWVPATGVCSGTTTLLRSSVPLSDFSSAISISADAFAASATRNLQFALSLPDQDEITLNGVPPTNTVQGKSVAITYTFIVLQRTATAVSQ